MEDCKRVFEMNNFYFTQPFYQLPDMFPTIQLNSTISKLIFVRPIDFQNTEISQQMNQFSGMNQMNVLPMNQLNSINQTNQMEIVPLNQIGQQNTVANIEVPQNPESFQPLKMEEDVDVGLDVIEENGETEAAMNQYNRKTCY